MRVMGNVVEWLVKKYRARGSPCACLVVLVHARAVIVVVFARRSFLGRALREVSAMPLSRVLITPEVYYACAVHAFVTEHEEVMGLLFGEIRVHGAATCFVEWCLLMGEPCCL